MVRSNGGLEQKLTGSQERLFSAVEQNFSSQELIPFKGLHEVWPFRVENGKCTLNTEACSKRESNRAKRY